MTYEEALNEINQECVICLTSNRCVKDECIWFLCKKAIDKQTTKKPRKTETIYGVDGCGEVTNKLVLYTCPVCDEPIHVGRGCSNNECLQKIDWSDEE